MNAMGFLKCVSCKARAAGAVEVVAPAAESNASSSSGGVSEEELNSLKKQLEEANNKIAEMEKKSLTGAPQTAGGTAVLASRLARQLAQVVLNKKKVLRFKF
jgi:predicted Zn-dependent protease